MPVIKSPSEPGAAADGRRLLGFYDFELNAGSGFEAAVLGSLAGASDSIATTWMTERSHKIREGARLSTGNSSVRYPG
jgi:hypothetical protein